MKMKSLILIFIALGCGLVASIGISQVMSQGGRGQKIEMDQILVAKDAIDQGAKMEAALVQLEEWPKQRIPEGAIRKVEEIQGKFAHYRFFKGEPILQAKINDTRGGLGDKIPEGYRVAPIKVDEDTVMESITPGDTVDVSVYLEAGKNGIRATGVYTILRNVRVFAKGGQTERTVDDKGQEVKARTVSLLVKPEQWRELVLAYRLGKIALALRPPDAKDDPSDDTVTSMEAILEAKGSSANSERQGDSGVGGGASAFPNIFGGGAKPSPNEVAGPGMEIHTPKGGSRFTFPEGGGAPQESVLYGPGSGGSTPPQPDPNNQPSSGAGNPGTNNPANPQ